MNWTSYLLGILTALAPSAFLLGLVIAGVWWKERHGRHRAIRQLLREVREEMLGR